MKLPVNAVFKAFRGMMVAGILIGGGIAIGWHWPARHPDVAPMTVEMTLDAHNRPAALRQFATLPDGRKVPHGQQFLWEWEDGTIAGMAGGLRVERETYAAGENTETSVWGDWPWLRPPGSPFDPAILTPYLSNP